MLGAQAYHILADGPQVTRGEPKGEANPLRAPM